MKVNKSLSFEENIILKIFSYCGTNLSYVLDTLTDQEQKVLGYRFGCSDDYKTQREVAKILNISASRVAEIENKAIRKLRHPSKRNILLHGPDFNAQKEKLNERRRKSLYIVLKALSGKLDYNLIDIEYLNLSVRAYTCLMRSNIHTVQDLMNLSDEDLLHVRNLGLKCFKELKEVRDTLLDVNKIELSDTQLEVILSDVLSYFYC